MPPVEPGEAEQFLFAHPGMFSLPDLSVIVALGLGVSQVSSSKKDKKLALATQMPRGDFLAHFRCKHSQEQSLGADINVVVSTRQCADASPEKVVFFSRKTALYRLFGFEA